jgi:prepilin-type N-terminal cleavage/methylation domain-containing protein
MLMNPWSMRGFTLIELAVTILVIGLLLAFSVPAFQSVSNSYQLKGTTENMAAQIRMAREKSIATGTWQRFHFFPTTFDADYHIHNGGFVSAKWKFPPGIGYSLGANSVYVLHPDGRVYDDFGTPTSGLLVLRDRRGNRDTVSIQTSGLILTK